MSRYQQAVPEYISARRIVDYFSFTWYRWHKYRKLGIVGSPDCIFNGRPGWLYSRLEEIEARLDRLP